MPRASLSPTDASEGGRGIQEGWYRIADAKTKVHQFPASRDTGEQSAPFPCVALTLQHCDDTGKVTGDDPSEEYFGVGKLDRYHPGNMTGTDDEDPSDCGEEVDVEGNCIWFAEGAPQIHKQAKFMILAKSLMDAGFKPEVLATGYVPSLIGTVGHLVTKTLEKGAGYTGKRDPTALVFDAIKIFPWDKAAGKKPAAAPAKKTAAAKPAAKAAAPAPATAADDLEEMAITALRAVAEDNSGETMEKSVLNQKIFGKLLKGKVPTAKHKPVLEFIKDGDWLLNQIGEGAPLEGLIAGLDDDEITFAG